MTRCQGTTVGGRRCKRQAGREGTYCAIHVSNHSVSEETEEEPVQIEHFKDGDMTQRLCGHCCDLTLEKCCVCADLRPQTTENRSHGYCVKCKKQYADLFPSLSAPATAPRNFVWYPHEDPLDNLVFNIFLKALSNRQRR